MRKEPYGRHAAPDGRPPWLIHPKKGRMPKTFRKILIILAIAALAVIGYYIYLVLNPGANLVAHRV